MKRYLRLIFSLENLKAIIIAIAIATVIRSCAFELFRIPSGSMKDTLLIDDVLLVSKYAYGYGKYSFIIPLPINDSYFKKEPQRGDIIIFRKANNDGKNYIKRLIGLPGETIQVIKGIVYINNVPLEQTPTNTIEEDGFKYKVYIETLPNGCSYQVKYDNETPLRLFPSTTPQYQVPQGHYFFLGDNRNHSIDSRYLHEMGLIPQENLIGRADAIIITAKDHPIKWLTGYSNDKRLFASLGCKTNKVD